MLLPILIISKGCSETLQKREVYIGICQYYQQAFTYLLILYEGCQNQALLYGHFWH